jgi:hypothetical protein
MAFRLLGIATLFLAVVPPASGQIPFFLPTPGMPVGDVSIVPDPDGLPSPQNPNPQQTRVRLRWTFDVQGVPGGLPTLFKLVGTKNGAPVGPIELPDSLVVRSGSNFEVVLNGISAGTYVIRVIATIPPVVDSDASPPSLPIVVPQIVNPNPFPVPPDPEAPPGPEPPSGPPTVPVLSRPVPQGNTVTLNWTYSGPRVTRFEIVAIVEATGQELVVPVLDPAARSFSQGNIPAGNFVVSMRAVNDEGASGLSAIFVIPVGVTVGNGDLSATLTWNSPADVDLHVVEPDGAHVFYGRPQGTTARLDRDDTDGFGPENIFVEPRRAAPGEYQVYIVHFGRSVPTTSRIQITIMAGTPNERTMVIGRTTATANSGQRINVATVNPIAGTIQPQVGLGAAFLEGEPNEEVKNPELP